MSEDRPKKAKKNKRKDEVDEKKVAESGLKAGLENSQANGKSLAQMIRNGLLFGAAKELGENWIQDLLQ